MSNLKFKIMISKKSNKADLEKKKPLFFEIGLTTALAMALVAFELSPKEQSTKNFLGYTDDSYNEPWDVKITRVEKKVKMKKPKAIQFEIVENTADIPEPDFNLDPDINPGDGIPFEPWEPTEDPPVTDDPFFAAEKMPEYRNGDLTKFHQHIQEIVHYPQAAIEMRLEGTVTVYFVVNKKGDVTDIKIIRGIDPLLDNEVIAAIKKSEKWKPGRQTGRPVNVAMVMPVAFKLQ